LTKFLFFVAFLAVIWWVVRRAMTVKPSMPREEAARFLGIASDADSATINEAHRRLIAKVHPDAGGNAELAARVNLARDTLLNK
jgi:hypothetical protein